MKEPLHAAKFLLAESAHERLPLSEAEVAFVGRSNVGKSSLINALTNSKLARVSKTPGATRGINVFEVRPGRWIVDLPGYGYAVGPARQRHYWPEMIGEYLTGRAMMKRVYALVDAEVGPSKEDIAFIQWLAEVKVPHQVVATKTDRIGRHKHATHRERIAQALGVTAPEIWWLTAKDGYGIAALQQDVIKQLGL